MIEVPLRLYSLPTEYMFQTVDRFKEAIQSLGYKIERDFYIPHNIYFNYDCANKILNVTIYVYNHDLLNDKRIKEFLLEHLI